MDKYFLSSMHWLRLLHSCKRLQTWLLFNAYKGQHDAWAGRVAGLAALELLLLLLELELLEVLELLEEDEDDACASGSESLVESSISCSISSSPSSSWKAPAGSSAFTLPSCS